MMTPHLSAVLSGAARWAVVEGDCRDVLRELPDASVDHVVTDPPYDQHTSEKARSSARAGRYVTFDGLTADEIARLVSDSVRVARRWCIAFCAVEQVGEYACTAGDAWVRSAVWHRSYTMPQLSGDRPAQAVEGIAIWHRAGHKRYAGRPFAFWSFPGAKVRVENGRELEHPTPKPLELMLALVTDFTDPGDLVLDPFAGSGTTGLACLRLGRRCILIEREPQWAALCRERLEAEECSSTLAAQRAGQEALFRG